MHPGGTSVAGPSDHWNLGCCGIAEKITASIAPPIVDPCRVGWWNRPELILLFEIFQNSATDQESMEMLVQEDSISPADIARAEDCLWVSPFNLINSLSGSSLYYDQNMNQFIMAGALKRTICSMDIDCQSRRSFSRKRVKGST